MRTQIALALALAPAASAVRLAKVAPSDLAIAMNARGGNAYMENPCRLTNTPMMCKEKEGMGKHSAAAVVSTYLEDIHWLNEMPWSDNLTVMVHERSAKRTHLPAAGFGQKIKDIPAESLFVAEESQETVQELNEKRTQPIEFREIPNKGDEAAAYLTWIIDHYQSLPDVTFFIQGHRCAEHANFDMARALPNIRQCFDPKNGYMDLNTYREPKKPVCHSTPDLLEKPITGMKIEKLGSIWTQLFSKEFGKMPTKICWDGYAQFAVSREAIQRHPVDFYKRLQAGVAGGITNLEFFWRAIFVRDATSWEALPKKDKWGKEIKKEYEFSEEEIREITRAYQEAEREEALAEQQRL